MRCEEVNYLLDLHLDRELPEELSQKVERHLLKCPACSYEARTLEQTRLMLCEAVAIQTPTPGYRERVVARLLDILELHPSEPDEMDRQWKLPLPLDVSD